MRTNLRVVLGLLVAIAASDCGKGSKDSDPVGPTGSTGTPVIGLSRTSVSFSGNVGQGDPNAQAVSVTNAGGGTLSGLSAVISYSGVSGWLGSSELQTSPGGSAPATVLLQAHVGSLAAATYTATVRISSPVAANSPQNISVTFTVSESGGGGGTSTTYLSNGVWITASWSSGKFEGPDTRKDVIDPALTAGSYYPPGNIDLRKRMSGRDYGLFVIYPGQSTLVTYSCVGAGSATQPSTAGIALEQCAVDVFDTPFARLRRYSMTTTSSGTVDFMFYTTAGVEIKILYCRSGYVLTGPPTVTKVQCARQ